jgi:hypothetical protein
MPLVRWVVRVLVEFRDGSWRWVEPHLPSGRETALARRKCWTALGYKAESLPCC